MNSEEIRDRWLRYFADHGHTVVPSASLISSDPTLLLVNAGMVPFKSYFLGEEEAPWPRAASVQKCCRTADIEEVGKTTRHASFFQMCGNFSFGDYFKEKAIPLAWELLTKPVSEGGYGLPEERLWVTIYLDDDEAEDIWRHRVGIPAERIQRLGMEENFWSMMVPGPCGPCSEICYDRGPKFGIEGGPAVNEERYLEIWNLVFMQFIRGEGPPKRDYPILGELPMKNIDTGLGLERLAAILQGVENIYEIDTTRKILDRATELAGTKYGENPRSDISLRVIADHMRTAVMLIGDGVAPSNEGRGYVLRRMLRRAIRNMRLLGSQEPMSHEMVAVAIDAMSPQYPELLGESQRIDAVATAEESAFLQTLKTGTQIFDMAVREAKRSGSSKLTGEKAFLLHDTFGFPIDLTLEMSAEQGLEIDIERFQRLMEEQRNRAKADSQVKKMGYGNLAVYRDLSKLIGHSTFVGYEELATEARVRGLLVSGRPAKKASEGQLVELVLDRTPFYSESGGQLADTGVIRLSDDAEIEVYDVQSPVAGLTVHKGKVRSGEVALDQPVEAQIDLERRQAISQAHSATHLTHQALRDALGPTVSQAGSENSPGRFRFDFSSPTAVSATVKEEVEGKVNELVAAELGVDTEIMSLEDARRKGAIGLFGEKYGDRVRVVSIGDYSREMCGGTHVHNSHQLGVVKLMGESSVGAGVRRIEALVGLEAYRHLAREHLLISQLATLLKVQTSELPEHISALIARLREADKEIERLRAAQLLEISKDLIANATIIGEVAFVAYQAQNGVAVEDLRRLALDVRGRFTGERAAVIAVISVAKERPLIVIATNEQARNRNLKAGELSRMASKVLGGGGGGNDDLAQGGGSNVQAITEAFSVIEEAIRKSV